MQLDFQFDGCLIKIETDQGLVGYGETGTNAANDVPCSIPRGRVQTACGDRTSIIRR